MKVAICRVLSFALNFFGAPHGYLESYAQCVMRVVGNFKVVSDYQPHNRASFDEYIFSMNKNIET